MKRYNVVFDWFIDGLQEKHIVTGGRLPSERILSKTLGTARQTVREAMRILAAIGIVISAKGSGDSAGTFVDANPGVGFNLAIRLHTLAGHIPHDDVIRTRTAIETWAAREGAFDEASLRLLEQSLEIMADSKISQGDFIFQNMLFHRALVAALRNRLADSLLPALQNSFGNASETSASAEAWKATALHHHGEHLAILHELKGENRERAADLLRTHIVHESRHPVGSFKIELGQ